MAVEHLFVTGAERSGTTVLVRFLQSHPAIALGMERYKYLFKRNTFKLARFTAERLRPAHFEADRFFDFRPTDTNIIPPNFGEYYDVTRERYASPRLRYVGDKILPAEPRIMRRMAAAFPTGRFVFIYRDALHVADSFERRARDPDDVSWTPDYGWRRGAQHWITSFAAADTLIDRVGAEHVCVVRYADLFDGTVAAAVGLFHFLGLDPDDRALSFLAARSADWDERQATPLILTPDQQRRVLDRADRVQLTRFDAMADARIAAGRGD